MNIEDGGGNNCKTNLRIGVKKGEAKGGFFERLLVIEGSRVKSQESRVLIKLRVKN